MTNSREKARGLFSFLSNYSTAMKTQEKLTTNEQQQIIS
jgi:hypothetical protein